RTLQIPNFSCPIGHAALTIFKSDSYSNKLKSYLITILNINIIYYAIKNLQTKHSNNLELYISNFGVAESWDDLVLF
ncbi:MAG: hypothetical protein AAF063_36270, partial [Cyanobacteria bacterium J06643_5]